MKSLYEELNGNYVGVGNIQIPALVSTDTNYEIGFWGQRHREHLKENHRVIYYNLLTSGTTTVVAETYFSFCCKTN